MRCRLSAGSPSWKTISPRREVSASRRVEYSRLVLDGQRVQQRPMHQRTHIWSNSTPRHRIALVVVHPGRHDVEPGRVDEWDPRRRVDEAPVDLGPVTRSLLRARPTGGFGPARRISASIEWSQNCAGFWVGAVLAGMNARHRYIAREFAALTSKGDPAEEPGLNPVRESDYVLEVVHVVPLVDG